MNINQWCKEIHDLAKSRGWYDGKVRTPLEFHMLMVSEIAEATEEVREYDKEGAEEREATELVDCAIRMFDYFAYRGWDFEKILQKKHEINKNRPYRHGGKLL